MSDRWFFIPRAPIVCVTWTQAAAFCAWRGARLPSAIEWEKAARGPKGRSYPWGEAAPTCARAVLPSYHAISAGGLHDAPGCGEFTPQPVGRRPRGASPYGVLDLAGNVEEWVADAHPVDGQPAATILRERRGGHFASASPFDLRGALRSYSPPEQASSALGFRCAR